MAGGFAQFFKQITIDMFTVAVAIALALFVPSEAAPGEIAAAGSATIGGSVPKIFSFENGNVGVNFLGFKAAAGLGGGLHAEAGTPFGQAAGAGLGGYVDEHGGKSAGGLYAGATAGGGVSAGAGLEGSAGADGSYGTSYAGASTGGVKVKTHASPIVEVEVQKEIAAPAVYKKHIAISTPVVHEVVEEKPQKTYIERTVIPQYEEKTIYVPSYEEKVVRVPTVVQKKVKVAVAPKVVEKTVITPPANVDFDASVQHVVEPAPVPVGVITKTRTKYRTRPFFRKHFFWGGAGGLGSGFGGDYGSSVGGSGAYNGGYSGSSSFTVAKSGNGQLINDIFNIPISTLGAVNKFVGGLVGGTSGSFSVSKTASLGAGGSFN